MRPAPLQESLMSQNWSELIAENYSCFGKKLLGYVCIQY